ncbi:MAG: transporter ATP-binding protein [Acidimicrobiaceae bacterium]|nr:transporter ATP-binding protein [Acidimicrobiaceae bacterium]
MTLVQVPSVKLDERRLAVRARGLERHFSGQRALEGLNLEMREGEFVALVGRSGSGKTTLLRLLAGLDAPDSGELLVPASRTVVFQEPRLIHSKRVWQNVVIGLPRGKSTRAAALVALAEVGLSDRADSWPATLSGGEAQRVALARAIVRRPQLLLLDEPFASLDALTRLNMQQLIGELCARHGPAALIVTHDVEEAILLADRVVLLREGLLAVEVEVPLERPRAIGGTQFDQLRQRLLAELGVTR